MTLINNRFLQPVCLRPLSIHLYLPSLCGNIFSLYNFCLLPFARLFPPSTLIFSVISVFINLCYLFLYSSFSYLYFPFVLIHVYFIFYLFIFCACSPFSFTASIFFSAFYLFLIIVFFLFFVPLLPIFFSSFTSFIFFVLFSFFLSSIHSCCSFSFHLFFFHFIPSFLRSLFLLSYRSSRIPSYIYSFYPLLSFSHLVLFPISLRLSLFLSYVLPPPSTNTNSSSILLFSQDQDPLQSHQDNSS